MKIDTARGPVTMSRTGDGSKTVVLLHPLAMAGEVWAPLAEHLAADFTVLAIDARGHGESAWDGQRFTVEELADDVAAALEALGTGPVGVIGMSMGGCVAVSLAERRPDLVDRMVLADTTACYGPDREQNWAERAQGVLAKPREELIPFQLDRWFTQRFRAEHPDEVQRIVDVFLATDSNAHAAACYALGAFDGSGDLERITADTLVLVGDEDYAAPPAMAEVLAERIPNARLEILEQTRHFSLFERSDRWDQLASHLSSGSSK